MFNLEKWGKQRPHATCWGEGGVKRPYLITREPMVAERRATRRPQDAECPQESNGAILFRYVGLELPKIAFDCMTAPLGVML